VDINRVDELITQLHAALDDMRLASRAGDRDEYIEARGRWHAAESELDRLMPPATEPFLSG
jgi:DNA-binding GntR family transcriptional regulator